MNAEGGGGADVVEGACVQAGGRGFEGELVEDAGAEVGEVVGGGEGPDEIGFATGGEDLFLDRRGKGGDEPGRRGSVHESGGAWLKAWWRRKGWGKICH